MFGNIANKIFGTKQDRAAKKLTPIVKKINEYFESYSNLSDEEIKSKTAEFKERVKNGETVDSIMPEAFGLVKHACKKLVGKSWEIDGRMQEWNMIPYDVQLMGAIILAQGKIAEMATGEGKTLVALFPAYLHALSGKGVHVVTVNDYLAKRDRDWMGFVQEYLGLSVGVITSEMKDNDRRKAEYNKDITYGINHEFGFDYLRDNMVSDVREMVQRGFHYCLIDEVDSVLIDEARTPLIISGVVQHQEEQKFDELKPRIFDLVRAQTKLVNNLVAEAETELKNGKTREGYFLLLKAFKALPKHKRLLKILAQKGVKDGILKLENEYIRDKRVKEINEGLLYSLEEKSHIVDLNEEGHDFLTNTDTDKEMFLLPDLSIKLSAIDKEDIDPAEKEEKKETLHREYSEKSDKIHTISQLLRAYSMFEKDVDYVVQDGKVVIVDQSTGRLKTDSRFSDGMHQAIEAKENVSIGQDTQTVATITYQNYFRLYDYLSGMTGTAVTEENEFFDIYKLPVFEIPTNLPIVRNDYEDFIYKTKNEKYNAIIEEVIKLSKAGRPVLIGTPDVDVSEIMHKLLTRRKVSHNLLNAKNHSKEADIIRGAGLAGAITIATNMAGRGTDIKLGPGVVENGGLAIIGCERHNSRRIDRQLRGRAGRQGDVGSSRFYVSLEDNLMRIFGSERISGIMDKFGHEDGEPIAHPWITKSIERAQKKVEAYNFSGRKHVIDYDDVMNKKRNVIYKRRRAALIKGAIGEGIDVPFASEYGIDAKETMDKEVTDMIGDYISEIVVNATGHTNIIEDWDIDSINEASLKTMFITLEIDKYEVKTSKDLESHLIEKAIEKFEQKKEKIGEQMMTFLCKIAILRTIDTNWQDHLLDDESLRNGIGLMAHAQKDPLIEYKKKSFENFHDMIFKINQEALEFIFKAQFRVEKEADEKYKEQEDKKLENLRSSNSKTENATGQIATKEKRVPIKAVNAPKRNEPCTCGSGKKYKNCCGKE